MTTPIEYVTIPEYPHLRAAIHSDDMPRDLFDDDDPPFKVIVVSNERDYGHISTATWSDFGPVYQPWYADTWYRETDAGTEIEIGDDDAMLDYLRKARGAEITYHSFYGCSQSDWFNAYFVMDRDAILKEISRYNRKRRPASLKPWEPDTTVRTVTKSDRARARDMMQSYAKTAQRIMQGEVYGIVVEYHDAEACRDECDPHGPEENCDAWSEVNKVGAAVWNFVGYDYATGDAARQMIEANDAPETRPDHEDPDAGSPYPHAA
jgi:hypothetical protein